MINDNKLYVLNIFDRLTCITFTLLFYVKLYVKTLNDNYLR